MHYHLLSSWMRLQCRLGENPLISRFMTGLFHRKPALPGCLPNNSLLSLKQLILQLSVLFAFLTAQRTQTSHVLSLNGVTWTEYQYSFSILELLKQTSRHGGQNIHIATIVLKK